MQNKIQLTHWLLKIIFILAVFVVWVLAWRIFEKITLSNENNSLFCPNSKDSFSTLNITEVSPLWIKWEITTGDLRIVAWKEVVSWKWIQFQLSTKEVYKPLSFVIPVWAKFFASKRWKKFYSVSDWKALEKISVTNLIFFKTSDEAVKLWFKR